MGKFEQHLGQLGEITLDGEKYVLKPLNIEDLPDFFMMAKHFGNIKSDNPEEITQNLNEEGLKILSSIIDRVLARSYPEEPEEQRKEFGMRYFEPLMAKIMEMNTQYLSDPKKSIIKKIKDGQNKVNSG